MVETSIQGSSEPGEMESGLRRLWLIRHGETRWNNEQRYCGHSDVPLAPEGQRQARWLARRLRTRPIAKIFCSDLLRARQTAQIIAAQSRQPVRIEASSAWRELAFGAWEGLTYDQIMQQFAHQLDFFADPIRASPPGGESVTALAQRVWHAFMEIAQMPTDPAASAGDLALVSHGGPLRVLLCLVLGMPLEHQWQLRLEPGSLSAIDFSPVRNETMPVVTLAAFNVQRPVRVRRVLAGKADSPRSISLPDDAANCHYEGSMRHG